MNTDLSFTIKYGGSFITAVLCNAILNIAPLAVLCFVLVIVDCITAWRLSVRMKRKGRSTGKFKSSAFGKTVIEMSINIPSALLIAFFIQMYIFEESNIHLPQITAGVICFWQIWSILENISSGDRNATWAKILQKVMIDKAERHLDIDLHELKEENNKNTKSNKNKKPIDG